MNKSFINAFMESELAPGTNINMPDDIAYRFDVLERLAANEFCETYLLSKKESGKRFVMKTYPKALIDSVHSEAKLLSALKHSGLPAFESESENESTIFVLREYAEGIPLNEYLGQKCELSKAQAIHIASELCDILSYLHNQSPLIIHRDIKPSNIVFNPADANLTLIDFGISRRYCEDSDMDTINFGTKKFAPLEQYGFAQTDCRASLQLSRPSAKPLLFHRPVYGSGC